MTLQVKNSSVWATPSKVHIKSGGAWKEANQVWIKQGGTWYQMLITLAITANATNYNLYTALGSPTTPITATIDIASGVTLSSTVTSSPALSISGFAAGSVIYLINNGSIIGAGGIGGARVSGSGSLGASKPGFSGGTSIYTRNTLNLTNNGTVAGGGGGGGGGGRTMRSGWAFDDYTGNGGGGAGNIIGLGGEGGDGPAAASGTATTGGVGNGYYPPPGSGEEQVGSVGGTGGNLGTAGARGLPNPDYDGTNLGGAAGNAIDGISYTTKTVTGTILGPEVN